VVKRVKRVTRVKRVKRMKGDEQSSEVLCDFSDSSQTPSIVKFCVGFLSEAKENHTRTTRTTHTHSTHPQHSTQHTPTAQHTAHTHSTAHSTQHTPTAQHKHTAHTLPSIIASDIIRVQAQKVVGETCSWYLKYCIFFALDCVSEC
jgi:hypothetical protein